MTVLYVGIRLCCYGTVDKGAIFSAMCGASFAGPVRDWEMCNTH